jgi:hypothetical protein
MASLAAALPVNQTPPPPTPSKKAAVIELIDRAVLLLASEEVLITAEESLAILCGGDPFLVRDEDGASKDQWPRGSKGAMSEGQKNQWLFSSLTTWLDRGVPGMALDGELYKLCLCILEQLMDMHDAEDFGAPLNFSAPMTPRQGDNVRAKVAAVKSFFEAREHYASVTQASHRLSLPSPSETATNYLLRVVQVEFSAADETVASSERLLSNVNRALVKSRATCEIYGSSLASLATRSSDVDVSIVMPGLSANRNRFRNGEIDKVAWEKLRKSAVYDVKRELEKARFLEVTAIPFARIPVVKSVDPNAGNPWHARGFMSCDICFFNDVAVRNSHLLREYATFHGKARELMMLVKLWIKAKKIGNAQFGTPSSYCWMNMVVFYLQFVGVVPNLQDKEKYPTMEQVPPINGLNVNFATASDVAEAGDEFKSTGDDISIAQLLSGFFGFYANDFNVESACVSIRHGGANYNTADYSIRKTSFNNTKPWRLSVEDPFETHDSVCPHDLGIVIGEGGHEMYTKHLKHAYEITQEDGGDDGNDDDETGDEDWTELFTSAEGVQQSLFGKKIRQPKKPRAQSKPAAAQSNKPAAAKPKPAAAAAAQSKPSAAKPAKNNAGKPLVQSQSTTGSSPRQATQNKASPNQKQAQQPVRKQDAVPKKSPQQKQLSEEEILRREEEKKRRRTADRARRRAVARATDGENTKQAANASPPQPAASAAAAPSTTQS